MLRSSRDFFDFSLQATDGEIGQVHDLLFDDHDWQVRYLVVDTGPWILGRRVLLAPEALGEPDWEAKRLPVSVSKEQIKNSPEMDVQGPVTRERERELREYFDWPVYWGSLPGNPGSMVVGTPPSYEIEYVKEEGREIDAEAEPVTQAREPDGGFNLRSMREVFGYDIQARDGQIGHLEDFLVDETWAIRYMIVDTGGWLPGKKVLFAPAWVTALRADRNRLEVDLSQETIQESPEYDPEEIIDRDYEDRLHDHYARPKYWR